ncbi:hypothetical protein EXH44_06320 [Actinobacillus indolicus]|uniref:Uncharacterized protein n=1 Tax=Actinobacillus indolicus TaxID=51049 RepID=A0A4P7CFS6_9PAST|nr:hypothetical protein [Actinobacillus indolicus]QBQ63873.1 hypothetical protein EXH44_06320 [Actinobacillus indolicus]
MRNQTLTQEKLQQEIAEIELYIKWAKQQAEAGELEQAYKYLRVIKLTGFQYLIDVEGEENA